MAHKLYFPGVCLKALGTQQLKKANHDLSLPR